MAGGKKLQKYKPRNRYYIFTRVYKGIRSNETNTIHRGGAIISKDYKKFCKSDNINCKYATAKLHTGTGLVERTNQSMENLIMANLEDEINLRESVNRALYVLRFTIHSEIKKTPFEIHSGREPRTKLSNLKNDASVDSKDLSVYITRNSGGKISNVKKEDRGSQIQTRDDVPANQKTDWFR